MYVIVVGGGTVGYYMSRDLLERGHEVTLIERDQRRADWLETQLGSIVMRGDGCEVKFLSQTGIERADAIVAVTADDEDNLVALQVAKRHFKVKKTVARVNNPSNVEIFKALGVDEAVSATEVLLGAACWERSGVTGGLGCGRPPPVDLCPAARARVFRRQVTFLRRDRPRVLN